MSNKTTRAEQLQEFPRQLGRSITFLLRQRNNSWRSG